MGATRLAPHQVIQLPLLWLGTGKNPMQYHYLPFVHDLGKVLSCLRQQNLLGRPIGLAGGQIEVGLSPSEPYDLQPLIPGARAHMDSITDLLKSKPSHEQNRNCSQTAAYRTVA